MQNDALMHREGLTLPLPTPPDKTTPRNRLFFNKGGPLRQPPWAQYRL